VEKTASLGYDNTQLMHATQSGLVCEFQGVQKLQITKSANLHTKGS